VRGRSAQLATITSPVTAPTPAEVVMTFPSPAAVRLYSIAGDTPIGPAHIWQNLKNPVSYADAAPVGTRCWRRSTSRWGTTPATRQRFRY
jgi:hypothetical protein